VLPRACRKTAVQTGALGLAHRKEEQPVLDVILLAVGVGFFALSIAYVYACDRL
jgi:hypothetical protein